MNDTPVSDNPQTAPARKYDYDRLTARPKDFIPRKLDAISQKLSEGKPYTVDRMGALAVAVDAMAKKLGIVI